MPIYCLAVLLASLLISPILHAQQICSTAALTILKAGLSAEMKEPVGSVEASACKTLPNQPEVLLASAIFADPAKTELYEDEGEYEHDHHWLVMLIDTHNWQPLAKYKEFILQDASVEISADSIWLDTAPYIVAPGNRAFGVRLTIENEHHCPDGGQNHYLTLFSGQLVQEHLQPLIKKLPMFHWIMREGCACSDKKPIDGEYASSTLQILPTTSKGFYDLKLKTKGRERISTNDDDDKEINTLYQTVLRFDGKQYPLDWNNIPAKSWYRGG